MCNNINCKNAEHYSDIFRLYEKIVNCLNNDSNYFIKEKRKQSVRPGWNEYVHELHTEAKEALDSWVLAGKIRHGPEFEHKESLNMLQVLSEEMTRC